MSEHKIIFAAVVELADTKDLKSFADWAYEFDSRQQYQNRLRNVLGIKVLLDG